MKRRIKNTKCLCRSYCVGSSLEELVALHQAKMDGEELLKKQESHKEWDEKTLACLQESSHSAWMH